MQNLRGRREKRNFSLRMSAAAGPVEPERNFLFARTPEIPGGARPRQCADNTYAAVARSHRLCPFASCSLARARHPSLTLPRRRLPRPPRPRPPPSSPTSLSLGIARRATIDRGPASGPSRLGPRGPAAPRARVADRRVAIDPRRPATSSRPAISRKRRGPSRRPVATADEILPAARPLARAADAAGVSLARRGPPSLALAPAPAPNRRCATHTPRAPTSHSAAALALPHTLPRARSFPLPRSLYSS